MDCKETITFSWYTGSITVYKELLLNESAAYLKKLLNTADKNREEVSEELKNYIQEEIDSLDPKSVIDKSITSCSLFLPRESKQEKKKQLLRLLILMMPGKIIREYSIIPGNIALLMDILQ